MNASMVTSRSVALAGGLCIVAASAAPGQELYLLQGGTSPVLFRVDGPTGQVLDQVAVDGAKYLRRGLAMRWDGILYGLDYHSPENEVRLFRFDPKTGQGQTVGEPLPDLVTLAADPNTGRLYGTDWNKALYQVNHTTGETSHIGTVEGPWPTPMAMAIGRDGLGYVTDWGNVALFRVELATGKTEFICYLGSQQWFNDMAFDGGGILWGIFEWDGAIRKHDVHTCAGGILYQGWGSIDGLEVVPEGDGCYADCNLDGELDLFDFLCFVNAFNAGDDKADCTGDNDLSLFDFLCFVNSFNAGC